MEFLLGIVAIACVIVSLVCFIMVLIQMFQHDQTILAIVSIIFCGIGSIIAFVIGWMNADSWGIRNVMMIWTVCWVVTFLAQLFGGFQMLQGP